MFFVYILKLLSIIIKTKYMDSFNSPTTKPLYRGTQVVWYILGLLEILLAFRFILKLLGANAGAGFTYFIYSVTSIFTAPFRAVFPTTRVDGNIFEWTTLLAMAVYWLIAWGIIKVFIMGRTVSTPQAAAHLERQDNV